MMTDIEQMKAELEAEGWRCSSNDLVYRDDVTYDTAHNEDGLSAVEQAYAHLQERKELEALRVYVRARKSSDWVAQDLADEYNITANDESDDDEN